MPYDPHERVIKYFTFFDKDSMELRTADHIDIQGKTAALCPSCTRAAAFGIVSTKRNSKFEAYKPLLFAPMLEEEQLMAVNN